MHILLRKAKVHADCHVLQIESGWCGFAIEAARATGRRVTTITLSPEQYELARERVLAAGLEDRVSVEHCDYRSVRGVYHRIISIEMLEAVGHEYVGAFFHACDRLRKPDDLLLLQVIAILTSDMPCIGARRFGYKSTAFTMVCCHRCLF